MRPTALRVVVTDDRLTCMLRPDVLPAVVRVQFEHEHRADRPLDPKTAVVVLHLVRNKILEPFPDHPDLRQRNPLKSFDAVYLVSQRLAVPAATNAADGSDTGEATTDVEVHPDVLFALGLVDAPASAADLDVRGAPRTEGT